jgi:ribosomal-protein-alanine N-acetyltransferase
VNIKLETNRLILHPLNIRHSEMYFDFLIRNAGFFKKWSPKYDERYFELDYHKKRLENIEAEYKAGRQIKFGAFLKEDIAKIIGTVAFGNIIKGPFQSCFLGYRLDEKENGKGYMSEAIKKGLEYMFTEIKLHRIEANIVPYNSASISVVEKLGFRLEGFSRNYLQINGKWEDHLHYVILNRELE